MAYKNQIKCPICGVSVPDVQEDASEEELICNLCYDRLETINDLRFFGLVEDGQ